MMFSDALYLLSSAASLALFMALWVEEVTMWILLIIMISPSGPPVLTPIAGFSTPVTCNDAGRKALREHAEFAEKSKALGYSATFTCLQGK